MRPRIAQELELLRRAHPDAEHIESAGEDWFLVPSFPVPSGWMVGATAIDHCAIAFKFGAGYPASPPYGFVGPAGINFGGTAPGSPGSPVSPPFPGAWQHFSWAPEEWLAGTSAADGANILNWLRGIRQRLEEGA